MPPDSHASTVRRESPWVNRIKLALICLLGVGVAVGVYWQVQVAQSERSREEAAQGSQPMQQAEFDRRFRDDPAFRQRIIDGVRQQRLR
jgi:hypothetical protein